MKKKQAPFTVTILRTVPFDSLTYQPNDYDWITGTEISKSRPKDDSEKLFDKDSWSLIIEEIPMD